MSARRRKPQLSHLDFADGGALFDDDELARFKSISEGDAPPEVKAFFQVILRLAEKRTPNLRIAAHRIALMLRGPDLQPVRNARPPKYTKRRPRGRPANNSLEVAVAKYEFDVGHWAALRAIGWGNVPADKAALDVHVGAETLVRETPFQELEKRRRALKAAVKRRRAKRRT